MVSGSVAAAAAECGQGRNGALAGNIEPTAEKVPEPHAGLGVGLIEAEDCIAAKVAAGSGADLPPSDLAADIVLGHVLIALDGTEVFLLRQNPLLAMLEAAAQRRQDQGTTTPC